MRSSITFKKTTTLLFLFLMIGILCCPALAFADGEQIGQDECQVIEGTGSTEDPYVYRIGSGAKVSWKHLYELNETEATDRYERLNDDNSLSYAWEFSGGRIEDPAGPYWLEVSGYFGDEGVADLPGGQDAYYFSLANKADFGGEATLFLNVSDVFQDAETLSLFYYGGISDQIVHGAGNPVDPKEYLLVEDVCAGKQDLVVKDGLVEVPLSFGGNFFLVPSGEADSIVCTASKPAIATRSLPGAPVYTGDTMQDPVDDSPIEEEQSQLPLAEEQEGLSTQQIVLIAVLIIAVAGVAIFALAIRRLNRKKAAADSDKASL